MSGRNASIPYGCDPGRARRHHPSTGRRDRDRRQRVPARRRGSRRCHFTVPLAPGLAEAQCRHCSLRPGRRQGHPRLHPRPAGTPRHPHGRPHLGGGAYGEAEILASCYRRSLEVADELGVTRIAFPAIATGVYGYPSDQAAHIAVTALRDTPTNVATIRLDAFAQQTYDLLAAEIQKWDVRKRAEQPSTSACVPAPRTPQPASTPPRATPAEPPRTGSRCRPAATRPHTAAVELEDRRPPPPHHHPG
jgi:hypothetical protein